VGSTPGRCTNSGQVVNTHVPLSPSSTIWYRSKGGDALQPTPVLASHWPCVTDFSGLSTYGLTAKVREMSTPTGHGPLYLSLNVTISVCVHRL